MSTPSVTRASLLLKIRDPRDRIAWNDFLQLYAPLIHAYGMHRGLQDADAADLVQEVLRRVSRSMPSFEYDRKRGTFRGWLLTVTRNEIRKMAERKGRQAIGSGDTQMQGLLEQAEDAGQPDAEWDREYRWNTLLWAAERVKAEFRPNTWQAFWRTVIGGEEASQVAQELKMSLGAVYIARSRVTARIKQEIEATLDE
jgi:RNA polymerase sigma-70 factor (ECF subfamily)